MMNVPPKPKDLRKKIENYSYSLNDIIHRGSKSVVFHGLNDLTNHSVALKVVELKKINPLLIKQLYEGEVSALKKLKHLNIVECYEIFSTVNNCYMITEYCNGGNLDHLLQIRGKLSESEAISIFKDVFFGFRCLAEGGYLHRNLNPSNIFLSNKIAKIGDFGCCVKAQSTVIEENEILGDPNYTSPLSLKTNKYSLKNDIWALGLILYKMLHNRLPWENSLQLDLVGKIEKTSLTLLKQLSQETKDFIRKCLNIDEAKRFSYSQLLDHPFIQNTLMNISLNYQYEQKAEYLPRIMDTTKQQKNFKYRLYWFEYLIRIWEMTPNNRCILKFYLWKQIQMENQCLTAAINDKANPYNIENWNHLLNLTQCWKNFKQCLETNAKKVPFIQSQSNKIVKQVQVLPKNLIAKRKNMRQEGLYIYSIPVVLEEIRKIYSQIKSCIKTKNQSEVNEKMKLLDYTISYYQICSLLVEDFFNCDLFTEQSYLELIVTTEGEKLTEEHIFELQNKIKQLQIL